MRIADVMTRDLPTVGTQQQRARGGRFNDRARSEGAARSARATRLVGIVTDWDLAKAVAGGEDSTPGAGRRRRHEHRPGRGTADATFAEAAQLMADRRSTTCSCATGAASRAWCIWTSSGRS